MTWYLGFALKEKSWEDRWNKTGKMVIVEVECPTVLSALYFRKLTWENLKKKNMYLRGKTKRIYWLRDHTCDSQEFNTWSQHLREEQLI